jgi:hypothetical protein
MKSYVFVSFIASTVGVKVVYKVYGTIVPASYKFVTLLPFFIEFISIF